MIDRCFTEKKTKIKIHLFALHPISEFSFIGESHGVCAISGFLQARYGDKVSIKIFDQQFISIDEYVDIVLQDKPDIIGVSIKMMTSDQFAILHESLERNVFPKYRPIIILGNSTAHFSGENLLRRYPHVIISLGEGEVSFGDIIDYLTDRIAFSSIRNIMYSNDGRIHTSRYEYLDNNLIPVADRGNSKHFFDMGGEVYIEGSRGCAYCGCNICECRYFLGSCKREWKWRPRPVESIITELEILQQSGIDSVTFSDEDFCGDDIAGLNHARMLAHEIVNRGFQIEFRINARVRSIFDMNDTPDKRELKRNTFFALKQAGLSKVFLGFESGSSSQLKRYNKEFTLNEFLEAKCLLNELQIDFELGYICMDPLMSLEELDETLTFIKINKCIPFISAIYKEMRIQKGNNSYLSLVRFYERQHNIHILGDMLFHEQMYDIIRYADNRVESIRQLMNEYTNHTYRIYYYLRIMTQYASTGSDGNYLKSDVYEAMDAIRDNDYELMVSLLHSINTSGINERNLHSIVDNHNEIRKNIYKSLIKRISHSNISQFKNLENLYKETFTQ